jgi:glycerol uptake facilitator-like aquaporin
MFSRNNIAAVVAEFLGSATLATVIFAMLGRTTFPFFADIIAGLAFGSLMLVFATVGSVQLNPAVTVGMWTLRKINTVQAVANIVAQMLGGLGTWALLTYLLNKPLTTLAGKSFDWRVLLAEGLGAFVFTFGVAAAIYQGYAGLRLAVTVGASLVLGMLVASIVSNGLLNPAVAVAVQSWDRAYAIGPVAGSIVGMNLYAMLFAPANSLVLWPKRTASASRTTTKRTPAKRRTTSRSRSRR